MRTVDVEILKTPPCRLGEGPFWDVGLARLNWVDIESSRLHCMDTNETVVSTTLGVSALTAAFPVENGWMLVMDHGFGHLSEFDELTALDQPEASKGPRVRMNDAACDPQGRLWAGSTAIDCIEPIGSLFRVDLDGSVIRVLNGLTVSNGIAWSPDGQDFYLIDSIPGELWAWRFDPDDGALRDRRLIADDIGPGIPDGMAVDEEGCLWIACFGSGQVCRLSPQGNVISSVQLPVSFPTSVCFGGPRLDRLFVTTAQREQGEPHAGQLLTFDPRVTGLATQSYRGAPHGGLAK